MTVSFTTKSAALLGLAAFLLSAGCATSSEQQDQGDTIDRIAERLVQAAEMRVDLRQVHACLHEIHEMTAKPDAKAKVNETTSALARELEHKFILALHSRMNLVEAELMPKPTMEQGAQPASMAKYFGASHLLVGDYAVRGDEVQISIRLVDAENMLIVGAAGGSIPLSSLSDSVRKLVRRSNPLPLQRRGLRSYRIR